MFYVLILYIFVGIILIRGSVWHVFMLGGERERGRQEERVAQPQCSHFQGNYLLLGNRGSFKVIFKVQVFSR